MRVLHRILAGYAGVKAEAEFAFDIRALPYWSSVEGAPQNTIIGGASLWVMSGHEDEEYAGVAEFLNFLSSADIQANWHQNTGYLPITAAAYEQTKESGFYDGKPGHRHRHHPDDRQGADGQFQGPASRQLRPDPRHHRRGTGSGLGRRQGRQDGTRQRLSSVATSCCAASSRPTADAACRR
jgi:ABC-type glycerol-3-phosphate transport system substrate-binding protein